jgi:hypothetical protein
VAEVLRPQSRDRGLTAPFSGSQFADRIYSVFGWLQSHGSAGPHPPAPPNQSSPIPLSFPLPLDAIREWGQPPSHPNLPPQLFPAAPAYIANGRPVLPSHTVNRRSQVPRLRRRVPRMSDMTALVAKPASKLKMIECKAILRCSDTEWLEIGAIVIVLLHSADRPVAGDHKRVRSLQDFMVRPEV